MSHECCLACVSYPIGTLDFTLRSRAQDAELSKTHNLVTGSINGTITETTEQMYNNMSRATSDFNKALVHPLHKSHYNGRTIPPVGEINR